MKNLVSAGMLTISVVALYGCNNSVDLKKNMQNANQTTTGTSTTTQTTGHAPTSIVVTPPGVTVIRVAAVNVPTIDTGKNSGTNIDTNSNTDTNKNTETGTGATTDINKGAGTDTTTDTGTGTADTNTDTGTDTTTDSNTDDGTDTTTDTNTDDGTDITTDTTTVNCEAFANSIDPFVRVQLNYGLLSGTPFITGELGGIDTLTVTADAAEGAKTLKLDSTVRLKPGQLITYIGSNRHNRVAKIGEVGADQVTITSGRGLEKAIKAGDKISNFYNDPTHPNVNGYKAVADFGYRSALPIAPNLTHALLGDSWFDKNDTSGAVEFENQLKVRLPGATIINSGIGGSTLCDLIERFDTDIAPKNPQYVWINSSINDYYNNVSPQNFKLRLQFLISKVQGINAKAVVFDSAPANGTSATGININGLSNGYSGVTLKLLEEAQAQQ